MNEPKHVFHPFPPLYDENSRVLILGSFPSVKSREQKFFYGHPQNRFWRVLAAVFASETPQTMAEKRRFLLSHGIALWDVIAACEITGSADSSIKNAVANDLSPADFCQWENRGKILSEVHGSGNRACGRLSAIHFTR